MPIAILLSAKKDNGKDRYKHCHLARYNKKSYYYYLILANQCPVNWELYLGKKHLLQENLADIKLMQFSQSIIVAYIVNHGSKDTKCYLDSALEVYMCYDRLLFSIYKEKDSPLIYTTDHAKLIV